MRQEVINMCDFGKKRVVFYGRNDYAAGVHRDRCQSMLTNVENANLASINDAIEAHQTKLNI